MSYGRRKALRRSLLEKEFTDDYSLNPKVARQGRDFGPQATQLLNTVTSKKQDTEIRHDTLERARLQTAKLDPLKLLEDAIKSAGQENDDEEYEALMTRYYRGDHILGNKAKDEMADSELESKMHAEAANLISESKTMTDFSTLKIGEVVLPPISPHYANSLNRSTKYIKNMKDRLYLDTKLRQCKVAVQDLQDEIDIKEKEIAEVTVSIEMSDREGDFDWHLEMNSKVRALTVHLDVDKEDLAHAKSELAKVESTIAKRYPDMSAQMSLGILDQASKIVVKEGSDPLDEANLTCINVAGEEVNLVYGWLLGKLTPKGHVSTMLFGQFTQKTVPPRRGWTFIGTNVQMDDPLQHAREEEGQQTGVSEEFMLQVKNDKLKIKNVKAAVLSTDAATGKKNITKVLAVVVKGCTHNEVNGRYMEQGFMNNSQIFANVNGWTITRQQLQEIPEMDIYADGCYAPATLESGAESVSARMYNRTGNVMTELLKTKKDGSDGLQDGSAAFKRRFAELARVGNRMIVADHQSDLVHTETIKAENRVQSDEEMLLRISLATKQMQNTGNDFVTTLEGVDEEEGDQSDDEFDMDVDEVVKDVEEKSVASRKSSMSEESTVIDEGRDLPPDTIPSGLLNTVKDTGKESSMKLLKSSATTTRKFGRSSSQKVGKESNASKTKSFSPDSTIKPNPTAAESTAAFLITQDTNTGKPVDSYNNLDFKVMSTKNIQSQLGSQGFHHISKKTKEHVEEEADLYTETIRAVEEREDVLYELKIEAADVQNRYITSHERSNIIDDEKSLARLIEILDKLRNSTVHAVEAIGAWARQASRLRDKEEAAKNYLSSVDLNKANRKYAVVLSLKGPQLYPQSAAMQYTNNRRFRRQLETAQSAVEVKYVGTYDTKDEACKAFIEAAASVPLEQRYAPYEGSAPKMFIGLRQCGNHYMVRSVGVPPDLLCEQCGASKASNFKQFIPQATDKMFPQFLFHGENYLDKMWVDTQFLGTVMLMNHYFGQFDCFMNPLQLTKKKIGEVMDDIILFASNLKQNKDGLAGYIDVKPLNNLRGKYERFRVASEDAIKRNRKPKEITIDGIAYRMPGKRPDLDSDFLQPRAKKFMSIDPHHLNQVEAQELKKRLEDETNANLSLNLESYSFGGGQFGTLSEVTGEEDFKYTAHGDEADNTLNNPENDISNALNDRLRMAISRYGVESEDFSDRPSAVLQGIDSGAGTLSIQRLQRAMVILGQSQALNQNFFKAQKVKEDNELPPPGSSRVFSAGASASTSSTGAFPGSNKRVMSKSAGGTRNKKRRNSEAVVETVVQYTYFGAQLKTVQMRPKVAHRVDNVWVRSDQGEWFGTQTKGRHMKRFDRIERIVQEGKRRQEDRAELSRLITKAIELDFVEGDADHVTYIKSLIVRSAKHKGSVLDLDVLKAEKYIKDRKNFILAVRFVQRCYRGYNMRVYVWYLREARRIKRLKMVLLDKEAAKLARSFVPNILAGVVSSQTKILAAKQFQIASNFGGVPMVVSVYARPRGLRRNQNICIGCQMRSQKESYDPSKRKKWNDQEPCYFSDRYPCSCTMIQGPECWLLEVYDPVSCKKYFKEFTAEQIQHYVFRSYYESQKLADTLYHKYMLYGKDFGIMRALFDPDVKSQYGSDFFDSEGKYRMDASREYAVLGQIPRTYSEHLIYGMTHYKLTPELANVYASHLLQNIRRPIKVHNIERSGGKYIDDDSPDEISWQPIDDVLYAKHQFEHIKLIAPVMEKFMFKSRVEWEESRDLLHNHLIGRFEQSSMEYEDMRSSLFRAEDNLHKAEVLVKNVMEFSVSGLEKIEAEERGEREDWNQAWEGLEDASRWQNLNNARKFRVKLANTLSSFDDMVQTHQGVLDDHEKLIEQEYQRRQLVNGDRSKIEALNTFMAQTQNCVLSIRKIALEALHVLVSALIIPSRLALESQRKLKYPTTLLPYIREPSKRGQVDYRSGWDIIARKFMRLKPLEAVGIHHLKRNKKKKQESLRCVVTIYKDTLYRNYIISVRTSDDLLIKTEEHAMSEDFNRLKSDYSSFTAHTEDNEIMINQDYITSNLFEKPFNWPENRLEDRIEEERAFFDEQDDIAWQESQTKLRDTEATIGKVEIFEDEMTASRPNSRQSSRRSTRAGSRASSRNSSRPSSRQTILEYHRGSVRSSARNSRVASRRNSGELVSSRPGSANVISEQSEVRSRRGSGIQPETASTSRPISPSSSNINSDLDNPFERGEIIDVDRNENTEVNANSRPQSGGDREEKEKEMSEDAIVDVVGVSELLRASIEDENEASDIVKAEEPVEITVHVKSIVYNNLACRSVPTGGYHHRHKKQATEQDEMIAKLVKYIRLHPHSLRPCLGLLPFHRRREFIQKIADQTIWYRDMIRKSNSSWLYSEFCKDKTSVVCQREFVATMRDSYGEIVLRLRTPFGGKEFGAFESEVVIPFKNIVKSMMTKPLLLGAFLCETITNVYSDDLIKHILSNIDLMLPGEDGRWWRRVLTKEKTPAISYIDEENEKFRGPIFCVNKFVSGRYCNIKVYVSATFDLKFEFSCPVDGLFWFQSLKPGHEVTAIISNEAVKYFLLKKSTDSSVSDFDKSLILKLYHPLHIHGLIHFLLKHIELNNKVTLKKYFYEDDNGVELPFMPGKRDIKIKNREIGLRDNDAESDNESEASGSPSLNGFVIGDSECPSDISDDEMSVDDNVAESDRMEPHEDGSVEESNKNDSLEDDKSNASGSEGVIKYEHDRRMVEMSWRQRLRVKLWKCIKKFNLWVNRHNINITPLSSKAIAEIYTNLRLYDSPPEWSLVDRPDQNIQKVDTLTVYDGFWSTVDPRLVVRKPIIVNSDYLALNSASVYSTSLVVDPDTGFNNYKKPVAETVFVGDAYYRVKMGTDAYKSQVSIAVHETAFTDPAAESEVHRLEGEKMSLEDKDSNVSAELEVEMMMLRDAADIRAAVPTIPSDYLSYLVKVRDKNDALKAKLRRTQHKFLPMIDGIWDKVALNSYALTTNTLAISFDENKKQICHIDNEIISEKCKKFARFIQKDPEKRPTMSFFDSIKPSSVRRAARAARKAGKVEKSIKEIATENEKITDEIENWMRTLLTELRGTRDVISHPSIAFQQSGVSTKAYPGLGAPRSPSDVDGLTSSDGVNNVMSYSPTPFHENTFRTNVSWRRVRPLRHWELGNLVGLDKDYLRRARKGTKPHYLRHKGQVLMVSAPNIGPADRSSVSVYSPSTGESVVVGYRSNMKVPFIRGLKYYPDRDFYEESEGNDDDDSTTVVENSSSVGKLSDEESDLNIDLDSDDDEEDDTFQFESGLLRISKIEAFNLRSVVMVGSNDPYMTLSYGSIMSAETALVKGGGANVSWTFDPESENFYTCDDDEFPHGHMNFRVEPRDLKSLELDVTVWNKNKVSKPSVIGTGKVSLGALLLSKRWEDKEAVINLIDSKYRDSGDIHIHFDFIEKQHPVPPEQSPSLLLTREVAERVVWRAMVNGITVAAVKAAEKKLDDAYIELEKEVAEKCVPWYRHQHLVTVVDKAGNLEYSSVLEKKRSQKELAAVLEDPIQRQLLPSTRVTTKTAHQDTHLRKIIMKKFEPKNFQRKVSFMFFNPLSSNIPSSRAVESVLYGLFVPADEDVFPTPFSFSTNREWRMKCYEFLGCSNSDPPVKSYTFPAIVYSSKKVTDEAEKDATSNINLKMNKFIFEYIMQIGWRKDNDYYVHKKRLNHERTHRKNFDGFDASPTFHGDVVILMRHGESDFELMQHWCKQRHVERLEMLERRRLKELHEHQMRVSKFKQWRSDIFCIASKYGPLMENFFYRDYNPIKFIPVNGPFNSGTQCNENGEYETNSYVGKIVQQRDFFAVYDKVEWRHLRFLFLRYSELLKAYPKEMKHSIQMMDQDYAFSNADREFLFESYSRSDFISGEEFLKFQWNTLDNPRNLQYQSGHILYALYLGHCEHCCVLPGTCPIPGCNVVRQLANGHSFEYSAQHNSDGDNKFLSLRGSGYHPLELAVKKYLLELTTFDMQFVLPTLKSPIVNVISSEVTSECSDLTKKALEKKSKMWRRQLEEAKTFRYLHRRVIKPSWRSFLTADEVHEAKGGHDDREEIVMTYAETEKLAFYLPPPGEDSMVESAYLYEEDSIPQPSTSLENVPATATMTISTVAMRRMMGIHSDNMSSIDICKYDPAPPRDDLVRSWQEEGMTSLAMAENKNCMSTELYNWLVNHIRIQREIPEDDPTKSFQGKGNSDLATACDYYVSKLNHSMLDTNEQQIMFDRLLAQGVTRSMGGILMFLQILQGVIPGAKKRQGAESGRPEAAKRFVGGDQTSSLQEGLTLCIHHLDSDTSICLVIADRKLDIVADTFACPMRSYPEIAKKLYGHAGDIIEIHLSDGMCKDVTLSIRLKEDVKKKTLMMKKPLQDQYKHSSRRFGSVNKHRGRLGAAAFFLDTVEAEKTEAETVSFCSNDE